MKSPVRGRSSNVVSTNSSLSCTVCLIVQNGIWVLETATQLFKIPSIPPIVESEAQHLLYSNYSHQFKEWERRHCKCLITVYFWDWMEKMRATAIGQTSIVSPILHEHHSGTEVEEVVSTVLVKQPQTPIKYARSGFTRHLHKGNSHFEPF